MFAAADQEALRASQQSASEKVKMTRQSTLQDFDIDLDSMTTAPPANGRAGAAGVDGEGLDDEDEDAI